MVPFCLLKISNDTVNTIIASHLYKTSQRNNNVLCFVNTTHSFKEIFVTSFGFFFSHLTQYNLYRLTIRHCVKCEICVITAFSSSVSIPYFISDTEPYKLCISCILYEYVLFITRIQTLRLFVSAQKMQFGTH